MIEVCVSTPSYTLFDMLLICITCNKNHWKYWSLINMLLPWVTFIWCIPLCFWEFVACRSGQKRFWKQTRFYSSVFLNVLTFILWNGCKGVLAIIEFSFYSKFQLLSTCFLCSELCVGFLQTPKMYIVRYSLSVICRHAFFCHCRLPRCKLNQLQEYLALPMPQHCAM